MVRGLFFDLDGTLSDYFGGAERALDIVWDQVADRLAPHGKRDFLRSYWHNFDEMERMARQGELTTVEASSRRGRFAGVLRDLGADQDDGLIAEMSDTYTTGRLRSARLFPGVAETLAALREAYVVTVVTEGNGRLQKEQIRALGLEGLLHNIVVSQEAGLHKPDPALYRHALAAAGLSPAQSVMVGDRIDWDLIPAKSLGMRTVFFTQNNRYVFLKEETGFEPDWEMDSFPKLLELFSPGHSV
jgi:putative hydrolase of the HAD superfamily